MAKYSVDSINFVTVGKTEKILNLDISLQDESMLLAVEHDDSDADILAVADEETKDPFAVSTYGQNTGKALKSQTFICDIDENRGAFGSTDGTNRTGFQALGKNVIVHSLYDISDIAIKSKIQKVKGSSDVCISQKGSAEYLDIYAPDLSDNIIGICQLKDFAYCLIDRTTCGPSTLKTDLHDQMQMTAPDAIKGTSYSWKITSHDLPTYLYSTSSTLFSTTQLSSYFIPRYDLAGVKYNYMIEIPQSFAAYNDYEAGDMFGEIMQAKNTYDSSYSMSVTSVDTSMMHLSCTREYCGIDVCGDNVFLKFYDNVNYSFSLPYASRSAEMPLDVVQVTEDTKKSYPYQKIETLDGINKFRTSVKHKSNMFSLNINNTGVNQIEAESGNAADAESLKQKIKSDIRSYVRTLTKKFCPADTCLFDVYFDRGK